VNVGIVQSRKERDQKRLEMAWMKGRTEGSGGAEDVGFFFSTCPIGVDKGIFKKSKI